MILNCVLMFSLNDGQVSINFTGQKYIIIGDGQTVIKLNCQVVVNLFYQVISCIDWN